MFYNTGSFRIDGTVGKSTGDVTVKGRFSLQNGDMKPEKQMIDITYFWGSSLAGERQIIIRKHC